MADETNGRARVSSVMVTRGPQGGHDRIRVYNRGALAGELVVTAGDGEVIGTRLRGWEMVHIAAKQLEIAAADFDKYAQRLETSVQDGNFIEDSRREIRDVVVSMGDLSSYFAVAARTLRGAL